MKDPNVLGEVGEHILFLVLTRFHGSTPLFRPRHLGEKWPLADYLVELTGHPGMFFLLQVKSTTQGYDRKKSRLKVRLDRNRLNALATAPVPKYVVAVDCEERNERAFIVGITRPATRSASSISTTYPLDDPDTRQRLRDEVYAFWAGTSASCTWQSTFTDPSGGF